ncbi:MAG: GbsR/MarR family transcriptional regulator [Candidatus Thorarchaeota archaeon]|jgi:DNA-binding transcriptional regulator GbsR (MarR family)
MTVSKKFTRLRSAFVQTLEEFVQFRGNDPMIARIYAMIVLSPEPLTQEQIAKTTGYSRSQISRYLANLEQRQMISKQSTPGSRTMLYGGSARPFFDEFRRGIETAERFIGSKLEVIDHILEEWQSLPAKVKSSDESRKLKEVISTFSAWFGSYLDLLTDFNRRFDERLKKIERNLLLTQI